MNPENQANRPDDINPNATAGSEYPKGLSHSGVFGEKPIIEYPEPLSEALSENYIHPIPDTPELFTDGKLKEKKSKKGLIAGVIGGLAVVGVGIGAVIGISGDKDNKNLPPSPEPTVAAPTTPGTIEPTEAPTSASTPSPTEIPTNIGTPERNPNNVEIIPGWPINEADTESTLVLEIEQTPEELGSDFVHSLQTIYNANLQAMSDEWSQYVDNNPDFTLQDLDQIASDYEKKSLTLVEKLLPVGYEAEPKLIAFTKDVTERNALRGWLYAKTNPRFNAPIESVDPQALPESLVTEDIITNTEVLSQTEDSLTLQIDGESTPLNLDNTNIRSLPAIYERINEGSIWTYNVSMKKDGDHWVIAEASDTGTPKYQ